MCARARRAIKALGNLTVPCRTCNTSDRKGRAITQRPPAEPALGRTTRKFRTRYDLLALAFVALAVRIPALFASTHLGFDDGVYGASIAAMRAGEAPFRDVFSSQGPVFLPVVFLFDFVGGHWINAPRLAAVASGIAITLMVYCIGRELVGRSAARLAAALTATSGSVMWVTGPLTSDGLAEAWGTATVVAALWYRSAPSWRRSLVVGALAGAAVGTKSLLAGPAVLAAWLIVLGVRRFRHILAVPVLALGVVIAAAVPWGLSAVYDQSVLYHLDKTGQRDPGANLRKVLSTITDRDIPLLLIAAVALGSALFTWLRSKRSTSPPVVEPTKARPVDQWVIITWFAVAVSVVLWQDPMWRNHIAHVVAPAALLLALFVARTNTSWRVVTATALIATPLWAVRLDGLLAPADRTSQVAFVTATLRNLPSGAQVLSDEPGLAYRAGRDIPGWFVDASRLRIEAPSVNQITPKHIAETARSSQVCAVVVWSDRWSGQRQFLADQPRSFVKKYQAFEQLPSLLADAGYSVQRRYDIEHVVYVKRECDPTGQATAAAQRPVSPG